MIYEIVDFGKIGQLEKSFAQRLPYIGNPLTRKCVLNWNTFDVEKDILLIMTIQLFW